MSEKIANNLVLSIFPGIDLLGRAFEEQGYCVVRGPDLLWGGDIRNFHPPAGVFEGVIGGPPCKGESNLAHLNGNPSSSMWDEGERVIKEAKADWYVLEAVVEHDSPWKIVLSPRWLGEKQSRVRYFHSNLNLQGWVAVCLWEQPEYKYAVLAGHGTAVGKTSNRMTKYSLDEACELQGLPSDYYKTLQPFLSSYKYEVIGNGVPLSMGRAIAKAVRKANEAVMRQRV